MNDSLAPQAIEPHLTGRLGKPYLYAPECESTQALLMGSELPEGAVAVTDHQTAGRGRYGRTWSAPAGSSVLVSVLLRPSIQRSLPELSLVAAVAAAETVDGATGLTSQIKWPNDVMLNRRKVAGILCELSEGSVVVGIGINVNQLTDELPDDASTEAGSLRSLTGRTYERPELLGSLLTHLERAYDSWLRMGLDELYGEIGARDFLRGRRITVDGQNATAVMISRDGRLEVSTGNGHGKTRTIESGEVLFER